MAKYQLVFPRISEDILTKKRTVVHLPCDVVDVAPYEFLVGDTMEIVAVRGGPRVALVVFTDVTKCPISDCVVGDLPLLNLPENGIEAYRVRWDDTNSDASWAQSPVVWRIVFRYLPNSEPPEFSVAG
jgi:hypothetical protein